MLGHTIDVVAGLGVRSVCSPIFAAFEEERRHACCQYSNDVCAHSESALDIFRHCRPNDGEDARRKQEEEDRHENEIPIWGLVDVDPPANWSRLSS